MQYDEIFIEVRQRVAAFKYWQEFTHQQNMYGVSTSEDEYLDEAYRFLFTTASKDFIEFCAKKEGVEFDEYCCWLGIREKDLIGGK